LNTAIIPSPIQRRDQSERGQRESSITVDEFEPVSGGGAGEQSASDFSLGSRPIEAISQTDSVFSRQPQVAVGDDLSLNARKALQTFSDNTPSAQQQLGVELAGINTYA
jgi:hypothetical protein